MDSLASQLSAVYNNFIILRFNLTIERRLGVFE